MFTSTSFARLVFFLRGLLQLAHCLQYTKELWAWTWGSFVSLCCQGRGKQQKDSQAIILTGVSWKRRRKKVGLKFESSVCSCTIQYWCVHIYIYMSERELQKCLWWFTLFCPLCNVSLSVPPLSVKPAQPINFKCRTKPDTWKDQVLIGSVLLTECGFTCGWNMHCADSMPRRSPLPEHEHSKPQSVLNELKWLASSAGALLAAFL